MKTNDDFRDVDKSVSESILRDIHEWEEICHTCNGSGKDYQNGMCVVCDGVGFIKYQR